MSLEHAILGFLKYGPLSGYDLKSSFDSSVQHFWPADQSQIYRTLSKLAEQGMAKVEVVEQEDRPDRKVYHITSTGEDELYQWLTTPLQFKTNRSASLIQIFFAGQLSDEEILANFHRLRDHMREALSTLQKIPTGEEVTPECDPTKSRDAYFWYLTLEYGIRMCEANVIWLEDVIDRLERGEHLAG